MDLVLQAAPEIGSQYGVIINKVSPKGLKKIEEDQSNGVQLKAGMFDGITPTIFVHYYLSDKELEDEDNVVKPLPDGLSDFIEGMPPIQITAAKVEDIKDDVFQAKVVALEERMRELKENEEKARAELARQQEANAEQMAEMTRLLAEAQRRNNQSGFSFGVGPFKVELSL